MSAETADRPDDTAPGPDADTAGAGTAMEAEFDTVAAWTAEVALALGPEHHVPAGCRGSGGPAALRWVLEHLRPTPGSSFLDVGAGVGGPAAFAAQEAAVLPVLTEPQAGACRAARALFGLPVVQAASALPVVDEAVAYGWCLGVLCTVEDQPALLREVRRVLAPGARFGLLVYVAEHDVVHEAPQGNHFPTADGLAALLADARLTVEDSGHLADFAATPPGWQERVDAVEAELERRHGSDERLRTAEQQAGRIGRLIGEGEVRGTMLVVRPAAPSGVRVG